MISVLLVCASFILQYSLFYRYCNSIQLFNYLISSYLVIEIHKELIVKYLVDSVS